MILALTIYLLIGLALCYYNVYTEQKVNSFMYATKKDVLIIHGWTYLFMLVFWILAVDFLIDVKDYTPRH